MKLFPMHKYPPPVKSWHVPIAKSKLEEIMDPSWDLTMKKVIPKIDGVKDVRRIAHDADVALEHVKSAIQHLLYYDTILMVDLFLFGNIYAPTPEIKDFVANKDNMQEECADYVFISGKRLAGAELCRFFATFCTGRTVKEWIKLHEEDGIDVRCTVDIRRLVQFGVIKGLLYRVHKYAVSSQYLASLVTGESVKIRGGDVLQKYTDGCYNFDRIAADTNLGDAKVMEQLRRFPRGDVEIIYR
jgi:hypothetical protein